MPNNSTAFSKFNRDAGGVDPHSDVVDDVAKEIRRIGDDSKAQYTEIRKGHEALKLIVDKLDAEKRSDPLLIEQISKQASDLSTRQEALDAESQKLNTRLDDFETIIQRGMPVPGERSDDKEFEQARMIRTIQLSHAGQLRGEGVIDADVNIDNFRSYKEGFSHFVRGGDLNGLTPEQSREMSVNKDPSGGYWVTPQMLTLIVQKMFEADPIRELAFTQPTTTDAVEFMSDQDEAGVGWVGETTARTETSTPNIEKRRIPVHEQYALPKLTQKLLEDAAINVESWLANKVSDKFSRSEGAAFVTGTGVQQPRGFLTYESGTSTGYVEQVNMGNASALTTDGFTKVMYSLVEQYLFRGTWLMNRLAVRDAMLLKDGDGQYIWRAGLQAGQPSVILGVPVRMSTTMPTVTTNTLSVALADWREAYMIVDRLGISLLRDPYSSKPYIEYYFRRRVGGDVANFQAIKIGKVAV